MDGEPTSAGSEPSQRLGLSRIPWPEFPAGPFALLLAASLVLISGCLQEDVTEPSRATLAVQVSSSGSGLEGARVTVDGPTGPTSENLTNLSATSTVHDSAFTDQNGTASFPDLVPGQYDVSIQAPQGYSLQRSETVEVGPGENEVSASARVVARDSVRLSQGESDTLASGETIVVAEAGSSSSMSVAVSRAESNALSEHDLLGSAARIAVNREDGTAADSGKVRAYFRVDSDIPDQQVRVLATLESFSASTGGGVSSAVALSDPLTLSADARVTTFHDSKTGATGSVALHEIDAGWASGSVAVKMAAARRDLRCSDELRTLQEAEREDQEGERPLILVHGWQRKKTECEDFVDFVPEFGSLIEKIEADDVLDQRYRVFTYKYPTNAKVLENAAYLVDQIRTRFDSPPVLVGHSMGGLVSRAALSRMGPQAVRGVVTLGTPHEGSPLVDFVLEDGEPAYELDDLEKFNHCPLPKRAKELGDEHLSDWWLHVVLLNVEPLFLTKTPGFHSLDPDSAGALLREFEAGAGRLYSFGGTKESFKNQDLKFTGCLLDVRIESDTAHDGVVPLSSALPSDSSVIQQELPEFNHLQLKNPPIDSLRPVLKTMSTCEEGPAPVDANDFELSGSVARVPGTDTVQVTLNPVKIDGSFRQVRAEHVTIIENNCVRPHTAVATDDEVGVDLAFVQDMSGSMGDAVDGVRNSVLDFADSIRAAGIDAQFLSLGYSGPGSIPSSPDVSSCEYLGPFKDLGSASSFQDHVSNEWVATGGCDAPENALEAFEYTHGNTSWRSGAARVYINITDASHHTEDTSCNGSGPCTDQTLSSIAGLVGESGVVHAVGSSSESDRTASGGADPWKLADLTGGETLALGSGDVDLTRLGIAETVGLTSAFEFESASLGEAVHELRIRVEIGGQVAELSPGLVRYSPLAPSLQTTAQP